MLWEYRGNVLSGHRRARIKGSGRGLFRIDELGALVIMMDSSI
jgi:hypothetical protein